MDITILDEFALTIGSITEVVKELGQLEAQKATAAAEGEHDKMNDFLGQEQVCILKLRGLELTRQKQTEAMGFQGLAFREILSRLPGEPKEKLLPLFTELDRQLKTLLDARESAERMINFRLTEFQQLLSDQGLSYDESGNIAPSIAPHFHDRYV